MHDPMTVAFEIRYPWRAYRRSAARNEFERTYRESFATIWHVDPERDGSDDSCGWFKRARHGDKSILAKIIDRFDFEWDQETGGWFRDGRMTYSASGTTLEMFSIAAYCHFNDWSKVRRFMQRHLYDIVHFSENNTDSFHPFLTQKYGAEKRQDCIEHAATVIYGCILRWSQMWYQHPRWHVWHWSIQIHPLVKFKRWAFSRCCKCGRRFTWGYSPTTNNWHNDGPQWFVGERDVFHGDCDNHQNGPVSKVAQ